MRHFRIIPVFSIFFASVGIWGCGEEDQYLYIRAFPTSNRVTLSVGYSLPLQLTLNEAVKHMTYVDGTSENSSIVDVDPREIIYEPGEFQKDVTIHAKEASNDIAITISFSIRGTEETRKYYVTVH